MPKLISCWVCFQPKYCKWQTCSFNFIARSRSFWPTRPPTPASSPSSALCREINVFLFYTHCTESHSFQHTDASIKWCCYLKCVWLCCHGSETPGDERNKLFLFPDTLIGPQLQKLLLQTVRNWRGGTNSQRRVQRVMSPRGRSGWRHSCTERKGGEEEGEGGREREKGSSPISFCVYFSKVTQTKAMTGGLVGIDMLKREIWRGGRTPVCQQLCTIDDHIKY